MKQPERNKVMATRFLPEVNWRDLSKTALRALRKLTCRPADTFSLLCADTPHPQSRYTGNQRLPRPTCVFPPSKHTQIKTNDHGVVAQTQLSWWHCRPAVCSAGKMAPENLLQHNYPWYEESTAFAQAQFVVL